MRAGRLASAFLAILWPAAAAADSCSSDGLLARALPWAKNRAEVIVRAKLIELDLRTGHWRFETLERFKGDPLPGEEVWWSGVGRSFHAGGEYLLYAVRTKVGLRVDSCTRTQKVETAWFDLAYLRTGKLPAVPTLLRRVQTACLPCDTFALLEELTGPGVDVTNYDVEEGAKAPPRELQRLLRGRRPFVLLHLSSEPKFSYLVRGRSGALAELAVTGTADGVCDAKTVERACGSFVWEPDVGLRCASPSNERVACDQPDHAQVSWGPLETYDTAKIDWSRGMGLHSFEEAKELAPTPPAGPVPGIACWPDPGQRPDLYWCKYVEDISATPPLRAEDSWAP